MSVSVIRFCENCGNVMKIQESRIITSSLHYKCRACPYTESVSNPNELLISWKKKSDWNESKKLPFKDFPSDYTLPIAHVECPKCGFSEAVSTITSLNCKNKLEITLVCSRKEDKNVCGYFWQL